MNLKHVESVSDLKGILNNMAGVVGDSGTTGSSPNHPVNWNLMRPNMISGQSGPWLTDDQFLDAWSDARYKHGAFKVRD